MVERDKGKKAKQPPASMTARVKGLKEKVLPQKKKTVKNGSGSGPKEGGTQNAT